MDPRYEVLDDAARLAHEFVDSLTSRGVGPTATLSELRSRLARPLTDEGEDSRAVIEDLARNVEPGLVASAGPRYFGFVIGGALALRYYTGIVRHTKDLDLFVRSEDYPRVLEKLAARGYRTELTDPQWLAKVFFEEHFVDVIFGSGKGLGPVDQTWFEHAVPGEILGLPVRLCPLEEMIWSKAFIMERERYDGADVAHLLRARGPEMDWQRLLQRLRPIMRPWLYRLTR